MSADGRFVAFESLASNLVPGDTNATWAVFVRDRLLGTTPRASVDSNGVQGDGPSRFAAISADGRWVAFESDATNLVLGDANGVRDVFVHDMLTGTTLRASVDAQGGEVAAASTTPAISGDGRFVAFQSPADLLVPGDTNGVDDVFVKDLLTGAIVRASTASTGGQIDLASRAPVLSADGRFAGFTSASALFTPNDTNGADDVFVKDLASGAVVRASVSSSGTQANGPSTTVGGVQLSADGRYIVFESAASNLVAGDANGATDCFVHDRLTGVTEILDVTSAGVVSSGNSHDPVISADGRFAAFDSGSANLVPGDNNLYWDVFRRDRGPQGATPFCFGDGSGAACPCGNEVPTGTATGCATSLGSGGRLISSGVASLSSDTFVLTGSQMPNSSVLYFQGTVHEAQGAGIVFGDGLRCVAGSVVRLGTRTNVGGASQYPAAGDVPISLRGQIAAPGERAYQAWFRNAAGFCTSATFNLTNALSATWTP
jgi:Tol biopolymer transport system component